MLHLYENQIGFDPQQLGFPSIDGCHAVVVHVSQGLFGLHNFGGSGQTAFQPRAEAFGRFIQNHRHGGEKIAALFGICFHDKRGYSTGAGWREEMKAFSSALNYKGTVYGFDLSKKIKGESAYVEFALLNGHCQIGYKRWSKVQELPGAPPIVQADDLKHMARRNQAYELEPCNAKQPVQLIATPSNKGELHHVGNLDMESFKP
jgi:hypothetical protein